MQKYDIQEIPELPEAIITAVNDHKLAVFLGAGVSRLQGCSGWNELANALIDKCRGADTDFRTCESLKKQSDNKRKISIAYNILKDENKESFMESMAKALKYDYLNKKSEAVEDYGFYDNLWALADVFITTNADKLFDSWFQENNIYSENFCINQLRNHRNYKKLFHIHGVIDKEDSLVFRTSEYLKRYNDLKFNKFLKYVFANYTVLFIGYSLSEFELLDYLMLKTENNTEKAKELNRQESHYALMPYFSDADKIVHHDAEYYLELNVGLIPYMIDQNGYLQIKDVIKEWKSMIFDYTDKISMNFSCLKSVVDDPSSIKDSIDILSSDLFSCRELYRILEKNTECIVPCFHILALNGFFEPCRYLRNVDNKKLFKNDMDYFRVMMQLLGLFVPYTHRKDTKRNILTEYYKILNSLVEKADQFKNVSFFDSILFEILISVKNIKPIYKKYVLNVLRDRDNRIELGYVFIDAVPNLILHKGFMLELLELILPGSMEDGRLENFFRDGYSVEELICKYFTSLYKMFPRDLMRIISSIIDNKAVYPIYTDGFEENGAPKVSDHDYAETVINCFLWMLSKKYGSLKDADRIFSRFKDDKYIRYRELIYGQSIEYKNLREKILSEDAGMIFSGKTADDVAAILENTDEEEFRQNWHILYDYRNWLEMQPEAFISSERLINLSKGFLIHTENLYCLDRLLNDKCKPIINFRLVLHIICTMLSDLSDAEESLEEYKIFISMLCSVVYKALKVFPEDVDENINNVVKILECMFPSVINRKRAVSKNIARDKYDKSILEYFMSLQICGSNPVLDNIRKISEEEKILEYYVIQGEYASQKIMNLDVAIRLKNYISEKNDIIVSAFIFGFYRGFDDRDKVIDLIESGFMLCSLDYADELSTKRKISQLAVYSLGCGYEDYGTSILMNIIGGRNFSFLGCVCDYLKFDCEREKNIDKKLLVRIWHDICNSKVFLTASVTEKNGLLYSLFRIFIKFDSLSECSAEDLSNLLTFSSKRYISNSFLIDKLYKFSIVDENIAYIRSIFIRCLDVGSYFHDLHDKVALMLQRIDNKYDDMNTKRLLNKYRQLYGTDFLMVSDNRDNIA